MLDELGHLVWERSDYDNTIPEFNVFEVRPIIKPDKGFVAIVATSSPRPDNVLVHFSANGDVLSTQLITIDTLPDAPYYDLYLKDIQPTPDGGYVFAGYQYAPSPTKSWIVKTDSMGLTVPVTDCESVNTAVEEVLPPTQNKEEAFSIYPNPATDLTTIYIAQVATTTATGQRVELFNMSGQLVKTFVLPDFATTYTFSVTGLPVGVYICRLNEIWYNRLLIAH